MNQKANEAEKGPEQGDTVPNRIALADAHFDAYKFPDGASSYAPSGSDGEWDRSNPDLYRKTVEVWWEHNEPWDDPSDVEFSVQFHPDGVVAEIAAKQGSHAFGKPGHVPATKTLPGSSAAPGNPDEHIVWEGGYDVATCNELESATKIACALRLAGSKENLWITRGAEFDIVYDDPKPQALVQSPALVVH